MIVTDSLISVCFCVNAEREFHSFVVFLVCVVLYNQDCSNLGLFVCVFCFAKESKKGLSQLFCFLNTIIQI